MSKTSFERASSFKEDILLTVALPFLHRNNIKKVVQPIVGRYFLLLRSDLRTADLPFVLSFVKILKGRFTSHGNVKMAYCFSFMILKKHFTMLGLPFLFIMMLNMSLAMDLPFHVLNDKIK